MSAESRFFMVFTESTPGDDAEFNDWYNNVHLPDILALKGFKSARRFVFDESPSGHQPPRKYMAIYEFEGPVEAAMAALGGARGTDAMRMSDTLDGAKVMTWWVKPISEMQYAK